jgi:Transposase DNA-binding/Transposase Tn5 dimerisation domain
MQTPRRGAGIDPSLPAEQWAKHTFGSAALGDARRQRRLVRTAAQLAAHPEHSLSRALGSPAALKATYRLLHQPATSLAATTAPHRTQTLAAATGGTVLLVQDTSEVDYTSHRATTGLGPIGNGRGRGFWVQSVLAVRPPTAPAAVAVLGLAHREAFARRPAPRPGETSAQKRTRPRESDAWLRTVEALGPPPAATRWVHVGDRGADIYRFFVACRGQGADVLVRAVQNRRAQDDAGLSTHVLTAIRRQPASAARRPLALPARPGRAARTAQVTVSWLALTLQPPKGMRDVPPLPLWVVRVWEPEPPRGTTSLDWVLLTSVPTTTTAAAWERMEWYRQRWLVEEYHQGLKTGCRLEASQLRDQDALWALLGLCAPIAVRLVQLRAVARRDPAAPATTVFDAQTVAVVAALTDRPAAGMTVGDCGRLIARLGGHLGRRGDGEPGWKTLWWGWQQVQQTLKGVQLAHQLPPP